MKRICRGTFFLGLFFLVMAGALSALEQADYRVAKTMWAEQYGSQRAVVNITDKGMDYRVAIPWRMKFYPDGDFLLIHADSGNSIDKKTKGKCDRFSGEFFFHAQWEGIYYLYYMPYKPYQGHGSFKGRYSLWAGSSWNPNNQENIEIEYIEARSPFDSFYPMEVCATQSERSEMEKSTLDEQSGEDGQSPGYLIFCEDRDRPVRMKNQLPLSWVKMGETPQIELTAYKNEYYSFQIAIDAVENDLNELSIEFNELSDKKTALPKSIFTCFNLEGIDPYGKLFRKKVNIEKASVQPFWIGIDLPETISSGRYQSSIRIKPANADAREVLLTVNILDERLDDRGDSEPWRHSRLRWLNSSLGLEKKIVSPYLPVQSKRDGGKLEISILGRIIQIGENGLPSTINAGASVLARPIELRLKQGGDIIQPTGKSTLDILDSQETSVSWQSITPYPFFNLRIEGSCEFDGYSRFDAHLIWKEKGRLSNISLEIPWSKNNSQMMMGMNRSGRKIPSFIRTKWMKPQDSFWIGSADAGMQCELLGADYSGPMLNLYRPDPPPSWFNRGKGSLKLTKKHDEVLTEVTTGSRSYQKGEEVIYSFSLLVTPVKPLDSKSHFQNRYYHGGGDVLTPSAADYQKGVNVVNIHHANPANPYINYPFIVPEKTKRIVDEIHENGAKMKIYYTVRELTSLLPELWALRSLGDEILPYGKGGGYTWLQEHLESDYATQWYAFNGGENIPDAALLTSGVSRWYNYYIEGLRWMLENYGIDGLYLDDVAFDRTMLQRIRRVMEAEKPGCLIDLHSNTSFSKGPVIQYMEFFPYVDKLWFGESFRYDQMDPENWLVESSGIPFGLMGEMLQGGGNPWRGVVFGMTNRLPWYSGNSKGDPLVMWEQFDRIGLDNAQMIGWWDKNPAMIVSDKRIKATLYRNQSTGNLMVAAASWAGCPKNVKIQIDWDVLGLQATDYHCEIPYIKGFQEAQPCLLGELNLRIKPKKGVILFIEKN